MTTEHESCDDLSMITYRGYQLITRNPGRPTETIEVRDPWGQFVAFVHPAKVEEVIDDWHNAR